MVSENVVKMTGNVMTREFWLISFFVFHSISQKQPVESTFNPTEGFKIQIKDRTYEGSYTCRIKFGTGDSHDATVSLVINCELNNCDEYPTIVNDVSDTTTVASSYASELTTESTSILTTDTAETSTMVSRFGGFGSIRFKFIFHQFYWNFFYLCHVNLIVFWLYLNWN